VSIKKSVLILGSGGQLGVELVRECTARGYTVTGYKRADLDITDSAAVEQRLASLDPSIVINAAAYNMVDVAEKEPVAAYQVNALAVRNLALSCRALDAKFIHFSTDYVFNGEKGSPYSEQDPVHPLGAYAVSKLAGELYAQAYLSNPLVIRTSGVFGPGGLNTARGNFIELMLRLAGQNQPIRVVEDHVASPTYAPVLAARSMDLFERDARGVFHIGGGTPISWFDYARSIFRQAGLTPELRPTNEREYRTAARRPRFSALSNARMESMGVEPFPPLQVAIKSYLQLRERLAT
jgi:dTDP-4-dehydrorhamnose reductase